MNDNEQPQCVRVRSAFYRCRDARSQEWVKIF